MKVLLAPTAPGWAFDHRAKDLLSLSIPGIQFELKYLHDIRKKDQDAYDLIYPMTLDGAKILHQRADIRYSSMAAGITSLRSIEGYRMDRHSFDPRFIRFLRRLRGINTASDEICRLFDKQLPIYKTRVGIDEVLFKPKRSRRPNKQFTIGWVGRIDKPEHRELKGYDLVVSALKNMDVALDIRTFKEHYVPREKMIAFYQRLDGFICSSRSEHIPLPILEASACGVPIITTKVGIVPELIRHKRNGLIVARNSEAIRKAVRYLMLNPQQRHDMGKNVRGTIEDKWTWKVCMKDWELFFKSCQER